MDLTGDTNAFILPYRSAVDLVFILFDMKLPELTSARRYGADRNFALQRACRLNRELRVLPTVPKRLMI
jgi:hypothetical protein